MPLDPDFVADCSYDENGIFIDEILELDPQLNRIRVKVPTYADMPLTRHQRVHPIRHPRHVNGGLMVHITAIVGFAHAYHLLGLRSADGWTGYGARIHKARYPNIATIGAPLIITATAVKVKIGARRGIVDYTFQFTQEDTVVYESSQMAMYMRVVDESPNATP